MKRLIILFSIALTALACEVKAQPTLIRNGDLITLANTNELEVQFAALEQSLVWRTAYVEIVSSASGVRVSNEPISTQRPAPTGSKIPISFINGRVNIRLRGNTGDTIYITY